MECWLLSFACKIYGCECQTTCHWHDHEACAIWDYCIVLHMKEWYSEIGSEKGALNCQVWKWVSPFTNYLVNHCDVSNYPKHCFNSINWVYE